MADKKCELKSRTVQKSTTTQSTAPRWVPPTTAARVNQANTVTSTSANNSTGRSTTHETKASRRRITLSSTITYPPSGGNDTRILPSSYMKGCETIEDLIHLAVSHGDLVPKHLAAFWSRIPQLLSARDPSNLSHHQQHQQQLKSDLHLILDDTIEKLGRFGPRDIAGAVLGMAKIVKHYNSVGSSMRYLSIFQDVIFDQNFNAQVRLFLTMADMSVLIISSQSQHMEARMMSNLVYAFALIKRNPILHDGTTLLYTLSKFIIDNAGSFDPQGVSNVLWAYASLGETCPRLFETFAELLTSNSKLLEKFHPQHLANTVWSYSAAYTTNTPLFNKVAEVIVKRGRDLRNFKSQELSNILLAYARNSHSSPSLFTNLAQVIIEKIDLHLDMFNPQDLSIIVWAYATVGEPQSRLYEKVATHIVNELGDLHDFIPQHLTNILWSYAKIGEHKYSDLFDKIARVIIKRDLTAFELRNLSITAWSFATVNLLHPTLFDLISDKVITCKFEFHPQSTVNLLWAFASIGRVDHHLFSYLETHVNSLLRNFTCQDLATMAWSYAIANVASPDLDCAFIATLQSKEDEFNDAQLGALHQWQLWQLELGSHTSLPSSMRQRCYDAFIMDRTNPSHFQDDVINELTSLGFKPQAEMILSTSGYRLDACIMVHGEKVGIEVDGPYHFTGCIPNGHTILKRRQVPTIDNMKIISVPYWEWDALALYSSRRKHEYLLRKLSERLSFVITEKMINLNIPVKEEEEDDEEEERYGAKIYKRSHMPNKREKMIQHKMAKQEHDIIEEEAAEDAELWLSASSLQSALSTASPMTLSPSSSSFNASNNSWSLYNLPVTETLGLPFGREKRIVCKQQHKMPKQEQDINKEEAAEEEEQKVE